MMTREEFAEAWARTQWFTRNPGIPFDAARPEDVASYLEGGRGVFDKREKELEDIKAKEALAGMNPGQVNSTTQKCLKVDRECQNPVKSEMKEEQLHNDMIALVGDINDLYT